MNDVVMDYNPIFQASARLADVNNSSTNCFAKRVDVEGKPIIICSNLEHRPGSDWVWQNCYCVEFICVPYGTPADDWWRNVGQEANVVVRPPPRVGEVEARAEEVIPEAGLFRYGASPSPSDCPESMGAE
jgi:hypothetical protein